MEYETLSDPSEAGEEPTGHPMDADEFAHALGFTDTDIAAADAVVRQQFPEFFANQPES